MTSNTNHSLEPLHRTFEAIIWLDQKVSRLSCILANWWGKLVTWKSSRRFVSSYQMDTGSAYPSDISAVGLLCDSEVNRRSATRIPSQALANCNIETQSSCLPKWASLAVRFDSLLRIQSLIPRQCTQRGHIWRELEIFHPERHIPWNLSYGHATLYVSYPRMDEILFRVIQRLRVAGRLSV